MDDLGLSGIWTNQGNVNKSTSWFKEKVKRCLRDQFIQQWISDVNTKDICYNYRLYKNSFQQEQYLLRLPERLLYPLIRFRTLNHRLPIQTGRWNDVPRNERLCTKCNLGDIGDEFHYALVCPFFNEFRKKYIPCKFWKYPNIVRFKLLFDTSNKNVLIKLAYFTKEIRNKMV